MNHLRDIPQNEKRWFMNWRVVHGASLCLTVSHNWLHNVRNISFMQTAPLSCKRTQIWSEEKTSPSRFWDRLFPVTAKEPLRRRTLRTIYQSFLIYFWFLRSMRPPWRSMCDFLEMISSNYLKKSSRRNQTLDPPNSRSRSSMVQNSLDHR